MELGKFASDDFVVQVPYGDPPDQAVISIRYLARDRFSEVVQKATKITYHPKTHQREEKSDYAEASRLIGEAAVVGWTGISVEGQEFPFTPDNRDLLMRRHHGFSKLIMDVCTDLDALVQIERENVRGN